MILTDPGNPPHLDRTSRPGVLRRGEIAAGFPERSATGSRGQVARGLVLLWHDHWDAAHQIAQADEGDPDHDLLHALVHRREGDYGNAGYWLRAAGKHPCFPVIARRAGAVLTPDHPLRRTLLAGGNWNPAVLLDAIRRKPDASEASLLRALQAEEMIGFGEWLGSTE